MRVSTWGQEMTKISRYALICSVMGQWKDEAHLMQPGSVVRTWAKKLDFHLKGKEESQKNFKQSNNTGEGVGILILRTLYGIKGKEKRQEISERSPSSFCSNRSLNARCARLQARCLKHNDN